MLKDHPVSQGKLEFPIMSHPYPIVVGRMNNIPIDLQFITGTYSGASISASELVGLSFVNWSGITVAEQVRQTRIARLNSSYITRNPFPPNLPFQPILRLIINRLLLLAIRLIQIQKLVSMM